MAVRFEKTAEGFGLQAFDTPDALFGLGDGGAHYGLICDAAYPTYISTQWIGYDATILSGVVTYRHGRSTGELPGRLIRGGRTSSAVAAE